MIPTEEISHLELPVLLVFQSRPRISSLTNSTGLDFSPVPALSVRVLHLSQGWHEVFGPPC
eukprot:3198396-Heterocapsa_arctica.AAC.1